MRPETPGVGPVAFLRRFARPQPAARERCGLCAVELADEHPHLVEPAARRLVCACRACALLFASQDGAKYCRVPDRVELLTDFRLSDLQWEALGLPVHMAFFLHSTPAGRVVAVYPSPGGATEAAPDAEAWNELAEENPLLRELEADVEALLVNRVGSARDHYRVGIDRCYQLVGLVRTHWRGFSGGSAVWDEIAKFFDGLRGRSGGAAHA
jgi:hypothetical protein